MKRKAILSMIFLLVMIALYFGHRANRTFLKHYPRVQASMVTRNDLVDDLEVMGFVNSEEVRDLYINTLSQIQTVMIHEGELVRAGQTLMVFDPDAKKLELAECQNNITRLERELLRKKIEEYAPVGLQITEENLKTENLRKELILKQIRDLKLTAPISGRISLLSVKSGEYVSEGRKLCQIVNDALLTVEAEIQAKDAIKVKPGDSAEIWISTMREPYSAKVVQIMPPVKKSEHDFNNPRLKLKIDTGVYLVPGTNVRIRVRIARAKLTVTVPVEAVSEETVNFKGERDFLSVRPASGEVRKYVYVLKDCSETMGMDQEFEKRWVIRDNIFQVRKVYVKTGISSVNRVEIIKGLKPFEQVVTSSDRKIDNHCRVIVINRDQSYKVPIKSPVGSL